MLRRSKSRLQMSKKSQSLFFEAGNMLTHPCGNKLYWEQSKLLLSKQKHQKDLWMLNKKPQFMKKEHGWLSEQQQPDTDIQLTPNLTKRKQELIVNIIQPKKSTLRTRQLAFRYSDSDVTSEEQQNGKYVSPENLKKKTMKPQVGDSKMNEIQVGKKMESKKVKSIMTTSQQLLEIQSYVHEATERKKARFDDNEDEQW